MSGNGVWLFNSTALAGFAYLQANGQESFASALFFVAIVGAIMKVMSE